MIADPGSAEGRFHCRSLHAQAQIQTCCGNRAFSVPGAFSHWSGKSAADRQVQLSRGTEKRRSSLIVLLLEPALAARPYRDKQIGYGSVHNGTDRSLRRA
jgi:hypothetical protein